MKFRIDINGLRAIAVLAVVLFHFAPEKLPGGFAGVDVFFVISGYLMTSIIFRGFENNNFSFGTFILNRAKRIVPALLATVFILLVLGYVTLGPDAYKMLARHARDSLLFISNITYNNESGYFDAASNTKFLLHTWSLSVEWQFYIIYPLVLIALKRFFSISSLKIIVVGLLIASLIASIIMTKYKPETAYFMFYTRAWEMMIGGLAFLYPLKESCGSRIRFTMELVGLAIIAISVLKINTQTPWPGYMALLPVIGTYLCILAHNNNTILSGYIIEKIGLWSYSLYLVHWPIIVFDHMLIWNLSFKKYIVITFILAFISYQLIEKRRHYKWGLLISFIAVILIAVYVRSANGIEKRFDIPEQSKQSLVYGGANIKENNWKEINPADAYDLVFYGDSFNAQYDHYIQSRKEPIAMLYHPECISTENFYSYRESCKNVYETLKGKTLEKPVKTLVIAQAWTWDIIGLKSKINNHPIKLNIDDFLTQYLNELEIIKKETGANKIILIGINNHFVGPGPAECISKIFNKTIYDSYFKLEGCEEIVAMNKSDYVEGFNTQLASFTKQKDWLYFINPNDAVCANEMCIQIQDNLSLYADNSHFSTIGSNIVGKYIFDEIDKINKNSSR